MKEELNVCCDVWSAVPTLPVEANDDVKDEPEACAAEVVAGTTLESEGEVVVPVGSKPAIFIPIAVVSDEMKMQAANELPLF